MKNASVTERREFWKFMSAAAAFEQAAMACEYILRENINERHPLSYPLMVAVVVLYSRPFKQRKVVRLIEKMVPKELKPTHGEDLGSGLTIDLFQGFRVGSPNATQAQG